LETGSNPMDIKFQLAQIITRLYNSQEDTLKAEDYYNIVFKKGAIPEEMPEISLHGESRTLLAILPHLIEEQFVPSISEFKRLINQGGVKLNGEKVLDIDLLLARLSAKTMDFINK